MSKTPKAIQNLLDELEASRQSRKRAWEILQEIRWVLKDTSGIEVQQPARKTIDLEGRVVKEAVRNALKDCQNALTTLIHTIREYRKLADQPLTLRGSDYAHAVQEFNKAIDRAEGLQLWPYVRPQPSKKDAQRRLYDIANLSRHGVMLACEQSITTHSRFRERWSYATWRPDHCRSSQSQAKDPSCTLVPRLLGPLDLGTV